MPLTKRHVVETKNAYIDARHDPFFYVNMRNIPGVRDFEAISNYFEQMIIKNDRSVMLADLRDIRKLKLIEITRYWVPWAKMHKKQIDELSVGSAYLSDHPLIVKVVNAFLKLLPLASPLRIFEHKHEAIEWLYHLAELADLELPDESVWEDL